MSAVSSDDGFDAVEGSVDSNDSDEFRGLDFYEHFEDPIDSLPCNTTLPLISQSHVTTSPPIAAAIENGSKHILEDDERMCNIRLAISSVEKTQRITRPYFDLKTINNKTVSLSPVSLDKVAICNSETKGVYLSAKSSIEKGSVLVAIDYMFAITKEKVFSNAESLLSNIMKEGCTDFKRQLMKICKTCCDIQKSLSDSLPKSSNCNYVIGFGSSACVFALVAQLLRPVGQSPFEFYLRTLPDFESCKRSLPILFEGDELRMLKDELKGTASFSSCCFWRESLDAICKSKRLHKLLNIKWFDNISGDKSDFKMASSSAFLGTIAWEMSKGKITNFAEVFKWAVALFNSRSFTCMVPLLDLVNGSNDSNLCNVEVCKYDVGKSSKSSSSISNTSTSKDASIEDGHCFIYCLVSKNAIQEGDELVLHYGNKTPDLYFNQYGMHPDLFDLDNAFRSNVSSFSLDTETLLEIAPPSSMQIESLLKNMKVNYHEKCNRIVSNIYDNKLSNSVAVVGDKYERNKEISESEHRGLMFRFIWDDIDSSSFPWHIESLRNFISISLMSKTLYPNLNSTIDDNAGKGLNGVSGPIDSCEGDDDVWEDVVEDDRNNSDHCDTSTNIEKGNKVEPSIYHIHCSRDNLLERSCRAQVGGKTLTPSTIMTISRGDLGRFVEAEPSHRLGWSSEEIAFFIIEWGAATYYKLMGKCSDGCGARISSFIGEGSSSSSSSSSSGGSTCNEVERSECAFCVAGDAPVQDRSLQWFLRRLREVEAASLLDWMILLARYYRVKSTCFIKFIHPSLHTEELKSRIDTKLLDVTESEVTGSESGRSDSVSNGAHFGPTLWDFVFDRFDQNQASLLRFYRYYYATSEEKDDMRRKHSIFT